MAGEINKENLPCRKSLSEREGEEEGIQKHKVWHCSWVQLTPSPDAPIPVGSILVFQLSIRASTFRISLCPAHAHLEQHAGKRLHVAPGTKDAMHEHSSWGRDICTRLGPPHQRTLEQLVGLHTALNEGRNMEVGQLLYRTNAPSPPALRLSQQRSLSLPCIRPIMQTDSTSTGSWSSRSTEDSDLATPRGALAICRR